MDSNFNGNEAHIGAGDPLCRMRAYVLATELGKVAWNDAFRLNGNRITRDVASQLFRAVGSIAANLAEGYSRSSGKDRVRMFEYALGSARECVVWYEMSRPVLGNSVAARLERLDQIRRILLSAIPSERRRLIARGVRQPPS